MISSHFRALVAAAALASCALLPARAFACKCRPVEVAEAKAEAFAIFEGRVSKVSDETPSENGPPPGKLITLSLVRTWKGLETVESITLRTNESSASCGYTFALDTSYLVYASGSADALSVSSCSRTRPMSDAAEDLAALGVGITPVQVEAPKDSGVAPLSGDAGTLATPKPPAATRGGCASSSAQSHASLWLLGLPAVGLVARRRRLAR